MCRHERAGVTAIEVVADRWAQSASPPGEVQVAGVTELLEPEARLDVLGLEVLDDDAQQWDGAG